MNGHKPVLIRAHQGYIEIVCDSDVRAAMIAAELDDDFIEYKCNKHRNAFIVDRGDAYDAIYKLTFTFDIEVI